MKFELEKDQIIKMNKWLDIHNHSECPFSIPNNCGAIGGRLTYTFTGTSLGLISKVKCACGEEVDLTDYTDW